MQYFKSDYMEGAHPLILERLCQTNMEGTLVTTVMGVMKGCMFVRVHDVQANVRAVRMTEAVLRGGRSNVQ